jgi:hypothetical protein
VADALLKEANMDSWRDRIEILDLLNRHMLYIDLHDPQRYASLYTQDGIYESPFATARGTHEVTAMSLRLNESGFTAGKRHFNGPAMIDIHGDKATALSYWWVAETKDAPGVYSTGTYSDRLEKVNGEWKIAYRKQEIDPNWPGPGGRVPGNRPRP